MDFALVILLIPPQIFVGKGSSYHNLNLHGLEEGNLTILNVKDLEERNLNLK